MASYNDLYKAALAERKAKEAAKEARAKKAAAKKAAKAKPEVADSSETSE